MKRLSALLIALLLSIQIGYLDPYKIPYNERQNVQTYLPLAPLEEDVKVYGGTVNYDDVVKHYNFTDVVGMARKNALRMAALGVSRGVGNALFAPSDDLKNSDVLIMLVRLFDDWQQLEQNVLAGLSGASAKQISTALKDAYYQRAAANGILANDESVAYAAVAQRQDIARWLFNAARYQVVSEQGLPLATDWSTIRVENRAAVATLLKREIFKNDGAGAFLPSDSMNRAQFADLTGRVIAQSAEQLKLEKWRGVVIAKNVTEGDNGSSLEIKIVKPDNNLMSILLERADGAARGLVVLRNSRLVDQDALRIGDRVDILASDDRIRLVEVVADGSVDRDFIKALSERENVRISQGVVISNLAEQAVVDTRRLSRRRVRVELDDDAMVELLSSVDVDSGAIEGYPIVDGKVALAASDLTVGSAITLYTEGNNVLFVSLGKASIIRVAGSLREVALTAESKALTMLGFDDVVYSWTIGDDVSVYVNNYLAELKDLKSGAPLVVRAIGDRVIEIAAQSYRAPAGYIKDKGRVTEAVIVMRSGNKLQLKGQTKVLELSPSTQILRGNRAIAADALKVGDHLTLYYDRLADEIPSKVVVDRFAGYVTAVVRAKLINYNQYTDQIEVSNCQKLIDASWQACADYSQIYSVGRDVSLVVDGRSTNEKLNKDYVNREVYMIIKERFGRMEVSKMVFKEGYEKHYDEAIADYSTVVNRLLLKNNVALSLDAGTIYLKDDRVVDKSALRDNDMVYALVNRQGDRDRARIINIVDRSDDDAGRVFIGALQSVNPYDIKIVDYCVAGSERMGALNRAEKTLKMSDDTKIYNLTTGEVIDRAELFKGRYNRSENKTSRKIGYYRYYGSFVTDGDGQVISMAIRFKELRKNDKMDVKNFTLEAVRDQLAEECAAVVFSRGKIAAYDSASQRIALSDAYSYSKYYREWRRNQRTLFLDLSDALVVEGNRALDSSHLKVGKNAYFIRRDGVVFVAFLEE